MSFGGAAAGPDQGQVVLALDGDQAGVDRGREAGIASRDQRQSSPLPEVCFQAALNTAVLVKVRKSGPVVVARMVFEG